MLEFRVFDSETARLISTQFPGTASIDIKPSGEFFLANSSEVVLVPSNRAGEVLYIRIRAAGTSSAAANSVSETAPVRHYVATGFLGLEGELEEDIPEPPKTWWKKLFVD
jgi:hypothetical protein